jgi:hypothetical protein
MSDESKQITHCDEMFPNQYIKAGELGESKVTYTIKHIEAKPFEGDKGKQWKGVATFEEIDQQWTINKTNMLCIKAMFGALVPAWYGKRVVLFPTKDRFGREIVDCIRVWGSPDIDRDITVEIKFPKKKPVKMTMHKVTDQSQTRPAARPGPPPERTPEPLQPLEQEIVQALTPVAAPPKFKFSPEGKKLLLQMRDTTTVDMLAAFPVAINASGLTPEEQGQLLSLVEKRRAQILEKQLVDAQGLVASDDIPY